MYKKVISIFLSVSILLSFTVVTAFADSEVSPIMRKDYATLKNELRGFIITAKSQIDRDDWQNIPGETAPIWQTRKLQERRDLAAQLYASNASIKEIEDFLLKLFGGWDPEKEVISGDTKTYGGYIGGNLPYSPMQNALLLRGWAFDRYVALDPQYGYDKFTPVIGEVTIQHRIVTKPAVIIEVDGEEIIAEGEGSEIEKDANGDPVLVRSEIKDVCGIATNPGQYTIESWYNFAKQINKTLNVMYSTDEFPASELITLTRSQVQKKLDEYRAAVDALELIPSETDPNLTEEQKAEKRENNRLRSIAQLLVDSWDDPEANNYPNPLAYRHSYDTILNRQDGSTTQAKIDEINEWLSSHDISYKLTGLATDKTKTEEYRAWFQQMEAVAFDKNSTTEELKKYINFRETYAYDYQMLYVDEAEDPAKIRAEYETTIDYAHIRETVYTEFYSQIFCSRNYSPVKNAIYQQAESDRLAHRYDGAEAEFQKFLKGFDKGDSLNQETIKITTESQYWDALSDVMAAYEELLKYRIDKPMHELLYEKIIAFIKDSSNKSLYTDESWQQLEHAVAAYEEQLKINKVINDEIAVSNMSESEKAEATAAALEELNVKAYLMNEKFNALVPLSVKVTTNEILNAANQLLAKAQQVYDFLEGEDMPYTQESFLEFERAYMALKLVLQTIHDENLKNGSYSSYGDSDILSLMVDLIVAQTGLIYMPETCDG